MKKIHFLIWICAPSLALAQEEPETIHIRKSFHDIEAQVLAWEDAQRIAGSAWVIGQDNWADRRATTIKDMTDYNPSVFVQPRNAAEAARLSIRGSGLANAFQGRGVQILQDGIPLNKADGEFEFQAIDPWLVDFMEILPGANALEYGASNFGGAINLTSPTGRVQQGADTRAEIGSNGHVHTLLSYGKRTGNVDAYAGSTFFSHDGFREQNQQKSGRFQGNLGIRTSDTSYHRFFAGQTITRAEIPGAISRAEMRQNPTPANPINADNNYERNLNVSRLGYQHQWHNGQTRIENTFFWSYRDLDNPVTTYILSESHDWGWRGKYQHNMGENRIIFGINTYYGTQNEDRFTNITGNKGAYILTREGEAFTSEAYGQYEHQLIDKLYGIGGMQISYAQRNLKETFPATQTQNRDYAGANPRIGLRFDWQPNTQVFTNLSHSYEPPTLSELSGGNTTGFSDLSAQKGTTWEIGLRHATHNLQLQASYYHGWLRDEFVNYRFSDGTTDTINAPRTNRDGVELGINSTLWRDVLDTGDKITARLAYQWHHFRLDGDPLYGNNALPGVPEHFIRAEWLFHHAMGWYAGPNVEWSPKSYPVDLTNTVYAPGYAIANFSAGWAVPERDLLIYLEARNLFNQDYIATTNVIPDAGGADGRYYYPGEGRSLYAGVRKQF